ncbi:MAG: 50S ribosomal protein L17 [Catalinimonas sp.]
MRHGKKINHLSRTYAHRKSMLSNMASSLIVEKRVTTTVAKAKELRKYVEPLITKAKTNTTHSRRSVFSTLNNKESVQILFEEVAARVSTRPGGYTRILKLGQRKGDGAEMAMIELVDYNEFINTEDKPKKTRRSRRGRGGSKANPESTSEVSATPAQPQNDTDVIETTAVAQAAPADAPISETAHVETTTEQEVAASADTGEETPAQEGPKADDTDEEKKDA